VSGRIVTLPDGTQVHVGGRNRPVETAATHPHLFRGPEHFGVSLPPPPDSIDDYSGVDCLSDSLGNGPDPVVVDGQTVGPLGNCTACGACHIEESVSALAGSPVVLYAPDCVHFYEQSTGYVLGNDATDQGGDEITVLTSWRDKGLDGKGGHRIAGWLALDPANVTLTKQMVALFGPCLYYGLELPDACLQVVAGGTWGTGTPNPANGHCVVGLGYDAKGPKINTWGLMKPAPVTLTWDAQAQLAAASNGGNLFVVLSPEMIVRAAQKSPSGMDYRTMVQTFDSLGGNAVMPPPSSPSGAPPLTLLQRIEKVLGL
jgi:hypothetical protein